MNKPECFDFAMDFIGDPEDAEIREYVEGLEKENESLKILKRLIGEWDGYGWANGRYYESIVDYLESLNITLEQGA